MTYIKIEIERNIHNTPLHSRPTILNIGNTCQNQFEQIFGKFGSYGKNFERLEGNPPNELNRLKSA